MKLLLLNRHFNASHKALKGFEVLVAQDLLQAKDWVMKWRQEIGMILIHREMGTASSPLMGIQFLEFLKSKPELADLPVVLTTDQWSVEECARHQESSMGALAYIRPPYLPDSINGTLHSLAAAPGSSAGATGAGPVLEDATTIFGKSEASASSQFGIQLESEPESEPQMAPSPDLSLELSAPEEGSVNSTENHDGATIALTTDPTLDVSQGSGEALGKKIEEFPDLQLPVGEALVPGAVSQSLDAEVLKKYLHLREQDVIVLSRQLKTARDQILKLTQDRDAEKARCGELEHTVKKQKKEIDLADSLHQGQMDQLQTQMDDLKLQLREKTDKAKSLEKQAQALADEMNQVKERVRTDLRKIRVREKELENRLELLKRDSEAMLTARENSINELKQKIDLMEFNHEILKDQMQREKEVSAQLKERLAKASQMVRVAEGLLESTEKVAKSPSKSEPMNGEPILTAPEVETPSVPSSVDLALEMDDQKVS